MQKFIVLFNFHHRTKYIIQKFYTHCIISFHCPWWFNLSNYNNYYNDMNVNNTGLKVINQDTL